MNKIFIILLLILVSSVSNAEMYKWIDANGNINFSDVKPASVRAEELSLEINTYTHATLEVAGFDIGPKVVMYSTQACGYCKKAKKYFKKNNIAFTNYDINNDVQARRKYKAMRATGVPVIMVGDKRLNGFSESSFERIYKSHK